MSADKKTVFVAYPAKDKQHADMISDAVRRVNALPQPYFYHPWPFNDVVGEPLNSPILEKIEDSAFIVADITYMNLNVIYEIGYAIGRKKRVFLMRRRTNEHEKSLANKVGLFDTLGYFEYDDSGELQRRLSAHVDEKHLNIAEELNRTTQIYIVEPETRTLDATIMVSRIKKAGYRYRSFTPDEDTRLPATDAIRQVSASAGIVLLLQANNIPGSDAHNIRTMFVAGLAHGMSKPTLVLAQHGYDVPLDIRDDAKRVRSESDIIDAIIEFIPSVVKYFSDSNQNTNENQTVLSSLNIGDPRAENEMTTLENYYLNTYQLDRALRGEVNLIVGRKGSGKTALFIRARDKTRADKRNIMVDLKPEGYQLVKMRDDILEYLSDGAQQHLIVAFWEYLILLEVAYKLLEKDQLVYKFNHEIHELYKDLNRSYRVAEFSTEGDFSERLLGLSNSLVERYKEKFGTNEKQKLTNNDVTELVYRHDLADLKRKISRYLEKKRAVWVFFDNLDKGWSTHGVEVADAIALRCLVDAGRKVERDMRKDGHNFYCIVFVRNDVYDNVMRQSPDYGKEVRATLDWSDPDLLKEMLRLRLANGLAGANADITFNDAWHIICEPHVQGEDSADYLIERSLMRPRNLIKMFNYCRGFASNFGRNKINEDDIIKGLHVYSHDLIEELDRELTDVFPEAKDLLYHFLDTKAVLNDGELKSIFSSAKISDDGDTFARIMNFLLYFGVLGIKTAEQDFYIYNVNYDLRQLNIRASRMTQPLYVVNPAFWPGLGIVRARDTSTVAGMIA